MMVGYNKIQTVVLLFISSTIFIDSHALAQQQYQTLLSQLQLSQTNILSPKILQGIRAQKRSSRDNLDPPAGISPHERLNHYRMLTRRLRNQRRSLVGDANTLSQQIQDVRSQEEAIQLRMQNASTSERMNLEQQLFTLESSRDTLTRRLIDIVQEIEDMGVDISTVDQKLSQAEVAVGLTPTTPSSTEATPPIINTIPLPSVPSQPVITTDNTTLPVPTVSPSSSVDISQEPLVVSQDPISVQTNAYEPSNDHVALVQSDLGARDISSYSTITAPPPEEKLEIDMGFTEVELDATPISLTIDLTYQWHSLNMSAQASGGAAQSQNAMSDGASLGLGIQTSLTELGLLDFWPDLPLSDVYIESNAFLRGEEAVVSRFDLVAGAGTDTSFKIDTNLGFETKLGVSFDLSSHCAEDCIALGVAMGLGIDQWRASLNVDESALGGGIISANKSFWDLKPLLEAGVRMPLCGRENSDACPVDWMVYGKASTGLNGHKLQTATSTISNQSYQGTFETQHNFAIGTKLIIPFNQLGQPTGMH